MRSVGIAHESVTGISASFILNPPSLIHPCVAPQRVIHLSVDFLVHKSSISSLSGVYSVLE